MKNEDAKQLPVIIKDELKLTTNYHGADESNLNSTKNIQIPHKKLLVHLLNKVNKIDFRKIAELVKDEKLKRNQALIICIENILELSKEHNWGICRNHDFIYLYNGAYWKLIEYDEIKEFLGKAAQKMGLSQYDAKYFRFRDDLFKQFLSLSNLPKPEIPKELILINLLNGTYEITPDKNKLRGYKSEDFMTYVLPFKYNPDATAPLFEEYLEKVLPDKILQKVLAEFIGYVFIRTSTLKLEKALVLLGSGANGKSVFYDILKELLGDENFSSYSMQDLTNISGYYRVNIANKLVNYASEINGNLEASNFKVLASGEPISARSPHGKPFMIEDYGKLIFNCNQLPQRVEHNEGFFRRFLIIPFNVKIPESDQDKELAKKIVKTELFGIFNWVLNGLERLTKHKRLTKSDIVDQQVSLYKRDTDNVQLFLDEFEYSKSHEKYIQLKELYKEYVKFCSEDGYRTLGKKNFRKRLENIGVLVRKINIGNVVFIDQPLIIK